MDTTTLLNSLKIFIAGLSTIVMTMSSNLVQSTSIPTPVPTTNTASVDVSTSKNWAGYQATGGTYTAVSGTWIIPQVSSGANFSADATWVGIGGILGKDLIQSGTQATVAPDGTVEYEAWIEMLPKAQRILPLDVHGGDSISVSITKQSGITWLISLKNNTTGENYQTQVRYASSLSSAEWVEEAPSTAGRRIIPLDNFGTVQFSNAKTTKNGTEMNLSEVNAKPISMGINGQILASATAINADGSSFAINRTDTQIAQTPSGRSQGYSGYTRRVYLRIPRRVFRFFQ